MKKNIFIVNLILIITVLAGIEYYCYLKINQSNIKCKGNTDRLESNGTRAFKTEYKLLLPFDDNVYRNSFVYKNSQKAPVIWMGCSYAEGAGLKDEQTPCYKISELTGRDCINKSKGSTGTQFMYYGLLKDDIKTEVPEADYIIYTFIWNHLQRLYNLQMNQLMYMFNLRYENKNGVIKEVKPLFKPLYSSFFVKRVFDKIAVTKFKKEQKDFALFNAIMKDAARVAKEKYPNAKFIMIEFPEFYKKERIFLPEKEIKELESYGITVVTIRDIEIKDNIYDKNYWLDDNLHPSEELWDMILPQITKKYIN